MTKNDVAATRGPHAAASAMKILLELKETRAKMWSQIQEIMTAEQISELTAMRKGELLSSSLLSGGGSDASNLGDEDMPGSVGIPSGMSSMEANPSR